VNINTFKQVFAGFLIIDLHDFLLICYHFARLDLSRSQTPDMHVTYDRGYYIPNLF